MGFLERMLGNLTGGKFGGHHGGSRHGGYRLPQVRQRRCALLPAMRRFPGVRPMFRPMRLT